MKGYHDGWKKFKSVFGETLEEYIQNTTFAKNKKEMQQFVYFLSYNNEISLQVKKLLKFIVKHPLLSENTQIVWDASGRHNDVKIFKDGVDIGDHHTIGEAIESSYLENGTLFLFYVGGRQKDVQDIIGSTRKSAVWIERQKQLSESWKEAFEEIKKKAIEEKLDHYRDMRDLLREFEEKRYMEEKEKLENELRELILL